MPWLSTRVSRGDLQRQRKVISYVLAKFMGRAKEAAFTTGFASSRTKACGDAGGRELEGQPRASRRVALTWTKRNVSFAFIRWKNNARAYKMQRRRLESALVRMTSRVSFAAFSGWLHVVERNKRRRTILRRAAMRMSKRLLTEAFSDWCAKVDEKRYWDAMAGKIERCALAIANRSLKRAGTMGRAVEDRSHAPAQAGYGSRAMTSGPCSGASPSGWTRQPIVTGCAWRSRARS